MDAQLKFNLVFFLAVCALSYFATAYLVPIFGTLSYLIPGILAVAGLWLSKKFVKSGGS